MEYPDIPIPIFQRTNRVNSLRELKSVSLELRSIRPIDPPRFRQGSVLSKQPSFGRSQDLLSIKPIKNYPSSDRRSNFLFNRGFK